MSLGPGTTLGPYRVTAKIGEGGMGEVWQARDTKLDRDVALKVLPEAFTSDPDRLARFEREAQVLATQTSEHRHPYAGVGLVEGRYPPPPGPIEVREYWPRYSPSAGLHRFDRRHLPDSHACGLVLPLALGIALFARCGLRSRGRHAQRLGHELSAYLLDRFRRPSPGCRRMTASRLALAL